MRRAGKSSIAVRGIFGLFCTYGSHHHREILEFAPASGVSRAKYSSRRSLDSSLGIDKIQQSNLVGNPN